MTKNTNIDYYSIPPFLNSNTKITISIALIYIIIAFLTRFIFVLNINLYPFFPTIGFAIAAVMVFGRKAFTGIAIGSFLFSLEIFKSHFINAISIEDILEPIFICCIRALIAFLNAVTVFYINRMWCGNRYPFDRGIYVLRFAVGCLIGSIISVSIGIIPLSFTSYIPAGETVLMWSNWIRGNALGAIIFAPLVLSSLYKTKENTKWPISEQAEAILLIIVTVAVSLFIFETRANNGSLIFFLLLWSAYRFGITVLSLVFLIITTISVYCTGHDQGGFIFNGWNDNFLMLQLFLYLNMVSALFLKAILKEKENEKSKLKTNQEKLNIEKNILAATIQSPNGLNIFTLDRNLNYINYNSTHIDNMRNLFDAEIKMGGNLLEYIKDEKAKEHSKKIFQSVLKGEIYIEDEGKNHTGNYWKHHLSPIISKDNIIIGISSVSINVTELKLYEIQLEKNNYNLNERIKELTCLYNIFEINSNDSLSVAELFDSCTKIIPKAFQFLEITNCRIIVQNQEFIADKDKKTKWSLRTPITVNGAEYGVIEVGFFEENEFEHKFVSEEVKLLDAIANILSKSIESNLASDHLRKREEDYRILFENVQDVFFKTSIETKAILDVSPSCVNFNGITREEIIGQQMSFMYPDKDAMQIMFTKVLTEKEIVDYHNTILIKGEIFHVSFNAKVVCGENGEPSFVVGSLRDVTERKLAEENLKISEENYRVLFENVQDVFFKTSIKTETILEVSPSCEQFNGITREELLGQNMFSIYADEYKKQLMLEKLFIEHKIHDYNNEIVIKGEFFHVSINASILFDEDGEPEFLIGALRNITARKLAEEKLKESEDDYRSLFENVQDVFFKSCLKTQTILNVSPSCIQFNGITPEELRSQNMYSMFTDENETQVMMEKIMKEHKLSDYNSKIIIRGGMLHVSISAEILFDANGDPEFVIGSFRNITERWKAEENLKISEGKFRSIYENMQDIYYSHTLDGTILDLSPSFQKHFNYDPKEAIGLNVVDFYNIREESKEHKKVMLRDGFLNDQEAQYKTADGGLVYFSFNSKIIYDASGNPIKVEGSMRNVNDRIMNQKQLLEAAEKIKESEEKFRSIYENMEDVYFLQELDGTIIDVSPSAEKAFQLKREDLIGANARNLQSNPARYDENMAKLDKDGFINDQEVQFLTATGETVYFSINAKLIYKNDCKCPRVEGTMRNINERIKNQNELLEATDKIKQSEEEFRSIFESFEDIYFRTSLDGYIQNLSPSVEKILKYKREEIIGSSTAILYSNPKDRDNFVNDLKEKSHVVDFETTFKDKENNTLYASLNAHLIYDSNGDAMYIEGTLRDISERKQNELELEKANQIIRESEKKYRTIFESVRDVFFRASAKDDAIIDISPSCAYFDILPEDIIGKPIENFYLNPEDRQEVLKELIRYGEIKNYDAKFLINSKVYNVSINSKIIYDENNEPEFLIGSFRDVTARIQAEDNLKISEAKFRSIYENFEDVYYKTEMDGTVIDLSPSFERNFKMKRTDMIGSSNSFSYYNPEDRQAMIDLQKKNARISDFDTLYIDGEGNVVAMSINARTVYDSNGDPIYVEGTMRNINERSIMQEEMLAKNRTLEFQNTELEQFAYIASHDLQEPLITVIHSIQMLEEELGEKLDQDQKQYLQFINNSTARMQLLVKGLLDYSRIGKERKTNNVDCNVIISDVLADMNASLSESGAVVEYENLPTIEGNATEIRQLFQNLISNANKFRKKHQKPKIKLTAVNKENNWLFSIADNGIGIEKQDMDKVFVIFKRLHNRCEYTGTGIGLSHCKKIIEHHNGKIWVESKFNEGSTFKWTFPIAQN